jgi:hypothetical protein
MIHVALELQKHIDFTAMQDPKVKADQLSPLEWDQICAAEDILYPFLEATLLVQERELTLSKVIPLTEFLRCKYKEAIDKFAQPGDEQQVHLVHAANLGSAKLDKYYQIIKSSTVYVAAVILDPSSKLDFLQSTLWTESMVEEGRQKLTNL